MESFDSDHEMAEIKSMPNCLTCGGSVIVYKSDNIHYSACQCQPKATTLEEFDRLNYNGCSICRDPDCMDPSGQH